MVVIDGDAVVSAPSAAGVGDEDDGESGRQRRGSGDGGGEGDDGRPWLPHQDLTPRLLQLADDAPVVVDDDGIEEQRKSRASSWKAISACAKFL